MTVKWSGTTASLPGLGVHLLTARGTCPYACAVGKGYSLLLCRFCECSLEKHADCCLRVSSGGFPVHEAMALVF